MQTPGGMRIARWLANILKTDLRFKIFKEVYAEITSTSFASTYLCFNLFIQEGEKQG